MRAGDARHSEPKRRAASGGAPMIAGVLAAALALAATGCAPERWENPSLPESYWAEDQQDCRQVAQGTAEDQYDLDEQEDGPRSLDYYQPEEEGEEQMSQYSAMALEEQTFRKCMWQKGYILVREKQ